MKEPTLDSKVTKEKIKVILSHINHVVGRITGVRDVHTGGMVIGDFNHTNNAPIYIKNLPKDLGDGIYVHNAHKTSHDVAVDGSIEDDHLIIDREILKNKSNSGDTVITASGLRVAL